MNKVSGNCYTSTLFSGEKVLWLASCSLLLLLYHYLQEHCSSADAHVRGKLTCIPHRCDCN